MLNSDYKLLLKNTDLLVEFIEGLYTYWRSLERYAIIQSDNSESGIQSVNFIEANNGFANLVLSTYRIIEENVIGYKHSVYRQLSAGIKKVNLQSSIVEANSTIFSAQYRFLLAQGEKNTAVRKVIDDIIASTTSLTTNENAREVIFLKSPENSRKNNYERVDFDQQCTEDRYIKNG